MIRLLQYPLAALLLLALAAPPPLAGQYVRAQGKGKRLVLKDGSYQAVREWKVEGDRIRYYSTERYTWEELPVSLVDWEATEKYSEQREETVRRFAAEEEAERAAEAARSPEVAPGIRLPAEGGVFMLDVYQGQPELAEMVQNGSDIKKQTGKNILRAALNPFASARQKIVLEGARARIQSHRPDPFIYVDLDAGGSAGDASSAVPEHGENPRQRFHIVRLERKKDSRVVGDVKIALTGSVKEEHEYIDTVVEPVSGGWMKVVPTAPLEPGEYALVEMLGSREINLYVWDFGVDPDAPRNPAAWTPQPPQPDSDGAGEPRLIEDTKDRKPAPQK